MDLLWITPSLVVGKSRLFEMNSGCFVRGSDAYLIDPGIFPDEIDALASCVASKDAHLRGIIITHSHWDHILGPERIENAPIIAHSLVAVNFEKDRSEVERIVTERLSKAGSPRGEPFLVPHIDVNVADSLSLPCGGAALRLIHAPGHCDDQIIVYDTADRALWAADMLSDIEIPFIEDVSAYRATLRRLQQLDIATIVPGHGNHTSEPQEIHERLAWDYHYCTHLESEVERLARLGYSLEQTRTALCAWPLRRPDLNSSEHLRNIDTVYRSANHP